MAIPSAIPRQRKAATENNAGLILACFECGNEEFGTLFRVTLGKYSEILCVDPWACWARQAGEI